MKSYVITLKDHEYSTRVANRCIASAKKHGLTVKTYNAVDKYNAEYLMDEMGIKWTWANNNTEGRKCEYTGLTQFPYAAVEFSTKIACAMSHYFLWLKCIEMDEPILILEHDAVFLRPLPNIEFNGICQINDPDGATRRGGWWSNEMINRNVVGVQEKTWVTNENQRDIPDGLAGNSAYMIKPWAAREVIDKINEIGLWHNDALLCKQIFPYLEEYYPFITKVQQECSTTIG